MREPIFDDTMQKWGWFSVLCKECSIDYDLRDVSNKTDVPPSRLTPRLVSFDCPKGHHCESIKFWNDQNFRESCETNPELLKRMREEQTPEERVIGLCHSACIWAEVQFCGVRDGSCYFEVWDDEWNGDDSECPHAILSVPLEGASVPGWPMSMDQSAMEELIGIIHLTYPE